MGVMEDAVTAATGKILARDRAVRELALHYARAIDAYGDLTKLGPPLLAALEALQLSPRARKAVTPVAGQLRSTNPLDELANARARKGRAPAVDSGSS